MTRRLLPIVVLILLLASLLSTETAEVWCRAAVGATMEADDDDGPTFVCRHSVSISSAATPAAFMAAASSGAIVDEPAFHLPPFGMVVHPGVFPRVRVVRQAVAYAPETRGPDAPSSRFARPPPRGPPAS